MPIFLPMVAESSNRPKPVPFGFALYGVPMERHHELMASYWVQNWYAPACCMPYPLFMPTLRGRDYVVPPEQVRDLARQYPGKTWCLWNEPDRPNQDRTSPEMAIEQTHRWMELIGDNGHLAGYGVGLEPGYDGWRYWLDEFHRLGGPVLDKRHVHFYANDIVQWHGLYEQWQVWNAANGDMPTIISEAGGLPYGEVTDASKSIYYYIRQWIEPKVEAVYFYTDKPEAYIQQGTHEQ